MGAHNVSNLPQIDGFVSAHFSSICLRRSTYVVLDAHWQNDQRLKSS